MYPIKTMDQKSLIIWDDFRGQQSQLITVVVDNYNLVRIMVPKNLTHLLQSLDLMTRLFQKYEKCCLQGLLYKHNHEGAPHQPWIRCDNDQSWSQTCHTPNPSTPNWWQESITTSKMKGGK